LNTKNVYDEAIKTQKKYFFDADEAIQLLSNCLIVSVDTKTNWFGKESVLKKGTIARYKNWTFKSTIVSADTMGRLNW
jgi:hypothetical protein